MPKFFLILFFLALSRLAICQQPTFFEGSKQTYVYNKLLGDTVHYEMRFPRYIYLGERYRSDLVNYVVFDRQNRIGYQNTLNSIEYLTAVGAIPQGIIYGITLPADKRWAWTSTDKDDGKAELFLEIIIQSILKSKSGETFNLFIGHSRTAIFSLYSFIKKPEHINAVFAASAWRLGHNDVPDDAEFRKTMDNIAKNKSNHYLYFSSGSEYALDGHEEPCKELAKYLKNNTLPQNLKWKYYHNENADHFTNYGLYIHEALSDIFAEYRRPLLETFALFNSQDSITGIPWEKIDSIYAKHSISLGYTIPQDIRWYNSIASGFAGNFSNVPQSYRNKLTKEVLIEGNRKYELYDGFYSWYGEILLEEKENKLAKAFLMEAVEKAKLNPMYDDLERQETINQILGLINSIQ